MNPFEQPHTGDSHPHIPDLEKSASFYSPEEREAAISQYREAQLQVMAADTDEKKSDAESELQKAAELLIERGIEPDNVGLEIQ